MTSSKKSNEQPRSAHRPGELASSHSSGDGSPGHPPAPASPPADPEELTTALVTSCGAPPWPTLLDDVLTALEPPLAEVALPDAPSARCEGSSSQQPPAISSSAIETRRISKKERLRAKGARNRGDMPELLMATSSGALIVMR